MADTGVPCALDMNASTKGELDQLPPPASVSHRSPAPLPPAASRIQELRGHDSISTTQQYTDVDEAGLMRLYEKAHPRAKLPPREEPTFP